LWALAAVTLASCYDYSVPDSVVNGAVVITQENAGFSYATKTSYYLDPMMKVVEDSPTTATEEPLPSAVATAITTNMEAAGFGTASLPTLPAAGTPNTVGLKVTVLKGTVNVYYPGYWCDYWYYYSCYYSWSYAGSYNTGTMILEMGDLSATSTTLPVAWLAATYGVASTAGYNTTLAVEGVNRAFSQSPYLFH
jgi:hypothetical protein